MVSGCSSVPNFNNHVIDSSEIANAIDYTEEAISKGGYLVIHDNNQFNYWDRFSCWRRFDGESKASMKQGMLESHVRQATLEEIYGLALACFQHSSFTQTHRNKILNIVSIVKINAYQKWTDLSDQIKNCNWVELIKYKPAQRAESYKKLTEGIKLLDQLLEKYCIQEESRQRLYSIVLKRVVTRTQTIDYSAQDVAAIIEILQKTISLYSPLAINISGLVVFDDWLTNDAFEMIQGKPYGFMLRTLLYVETQGYEVALTAAKHMIHVMPLEHLLAENHGLVCTALLYDKLAIFEDLMQRGATLDDSILKLAVSNSNTETLKAVLTHAKKQELHKNSSIGSELLDTCLSTAASDPLKKMIERVRVLIDQDIINTDQINVSSFWKEAQQRWSSLLLRDVRDDAHDNNNRTWAPCLSNEERSPTGWNQVEKCAEMWGAIGVRPAIPEIRRKFVVVKGATADESIYLRENIDEFLKNDLKGEDTKKFAAFQKALYALWDAMEKGYQTRIQVYERVVGVVSSIGLQQLGAGSIVMEYLFGVEEVQVNAIPEGAMKYFPIEHCSADQIGAAELTHMTMLSMYPPA